MDIFSIPDWETNKTGDTNANQLSNTSVRTRTINAKKKLKKGKKPKNKSILSDQPHYSNIGSQNKKGDTKNSKFKPEKKFVDKKQQRDLFIGGKSHNRVEKINFNNNAFNNNNKELILKSRKDLTDKIQKQDMKRLKKRNKIMRNKEVLADETRNNKAKTNNDDEAASKIINIKDKNFLKIQNKKRKLINLLNTSPETGSRKKERNLSLRERMLEKLRASRFRYINEQIYNTDSKAIKQYFEKDPDAFRTYHDGYRQQISKWPLNPIDIIIKSIKKMPNNYIIADLGCGEAKLASSVSQKVHSFDLVAINSNVIACDMAKLPLEDVSVDVVVFCLSLMGPNIREYLFEAGRILRNGGLLKIAEVESRFDKVDDFIEGVKRFGFVSIWKDLSHNLFYFLDFKKTFQCKSLHKLPTISLHPCLYKKR